MYGSGRRWTMKRIWALMWAALAVATSGLAQGTSNSVDALLEALKAQPAAVENWIVVPIAGSSVGRDGATFHTDVALSANRAYDDIVRVAIAWLPLDREASADAVEYKTVPGWFGSGPTSYYDGLGNAGFGALLIAAVDSSGSLDPLGVVRADARVWSASSCAGETSLGYHPGKWLGADRGSVIGLRLGDGFRSNAGIVNGDSSAHTWRLQYASVNGGPSYEVEVTVAASSSTIVALDPKVSGPISLTIESETADVPWTGWGASVDNLSGDAWYASLIPF
jgi:hypothetical protein